MSDNKLREEIQKIVDDYKTSIGSDLAIARVMAALKPKTEFVKGEIVQHKNTGLIGIVKEVFDTSLSILNSGVWLKSHCQKLDFVPLNLTPWNRSERPEGLDDDDIIIYKDIELLEIRIGTVKSIGYWIWVAGYLKVHFL